MGDLFAIGDIHGCAVELERLLSQLPLDADSTVVFLGDYIDRGNEAPEVVDTILELSQRCRVICLKGNHEAMFHAFLDSPRGTDAAMFIYNGGSATLAAYADDRGRVDIPSRHLEFFSSLRLCFATDDAFFVHAGVPDIPLDELDAQHAHDMLWIREPFLTSQFQWGKPVVHGHTPVLEVDRRPNRINLDTGCALGNMLSAMELSSGHVYTELVEREIQPRVLRDHDSQRGSVRFEGSVPVFIGCGDDLVQFETLNYSEYGMLVREVEPSGRLLFGDRQIVHGLIGDHPEGRAEFVAEVVRQTRVGGVRGYALQILERQTEPY